MEGRIGQLNCSYRLISGSGSAFTNRLGRIAREGLGAACAQKLDGTLGGDQAVWVVRRISVDLLFNAQAVWDDGQIAGKWASQIVTAALREVTKGADGRNVIRFDDQADLVTHFLTDLLRGEAWQKWYYGCFQRLRSQPTGTAALAALLENREHIAQVLARLARSGLLEPLLSVLGPQALEQLWKTEWKDLPGGGEEAALRPVFLAALNLASRSSSQAWPTSVQMQRWLSEYARSSFVAPDWRDRSGLALAVMAALEFLWTRGYLGSSIAEIAQAWKGRESEAGNSFDWLDTELLENALARLARAEQETKERETALRPVFLAALSIVVSLQDTPTGDDTLQWLNEGGLREYARSSFVPSDWTDRSQLVLAVIAALEFLWKRGYLGLTLAEIGLAWREQGKQGGAEFAWLDRELLEQALARWTPAGSEVNEQHSADNQMLRPNLSTPRRRRFMADLAKAVALELRTLAKQPLDAQGFAPGCALRVYARLVAIDAAWSSDPLALQAVDGLLGAASWLAGSDLAWCGDIRFDELGLGEELGNPLAARLSAGDRGPGWGDEAQSELVRELRASVRQRGWAALQSSAFLDKVLAGFHPQPGAEILRLCMLDAMRAGSPGAAALHASSPLVQRTSAAGDTDLHSSTGPIALHVLGAADRPQVGSQVAAKFLRAFGDAGLDLALAVAVGARAAAKDPLVHLAEGVECRCAGVFLMVRAMVDARLATTAHAAGYSLAPCILALGLCWGGKDAVFQGRLDSAVTLLAGQPADMTLTELRDMWRQVEGENHARFQANLLSVLAARGAVEGSSVAIHRLPLSGGRYAVVLGNGTVWPLGRVVRNADEEQATLAAMMDAWREATQQEPVLEAAGEESVLALERALEAIGNAHLEVPEADLTLGLAAISLLRLWAVWLRQFSTSSAPYLLRNFIRRPGRIVKTTEGLVVELAHRPLDIVISMAGYLAPFQARPEPWGCSIVFRTQES